MPYLGLLNKRERLGLTWPGRIALVLIILLCVVIFFRAAFSFLAMHSPVKANILVVEGWMTDELVQQTVREFRRGNYQILIVTGEPLPRGSWLTDYTSTAQVAAATLAKMGVGEDSIVAVPSEKVKRNRTFEAALAVKKWLGDNQFSQPSINVFSASVHSRRSRLLFQRAFGDFIEVGVIAGSDARCTDDNWWKSSYSFRMVLYEIIAYIYAKSPLSV